MITDPVSPQGQSKGQTPPPSYAELPPQRAPISGSSATPHHHPFFGPPGSPPKPPVHYGPTPITGSGPTSPTHQAVNSGSQAPLLLPVPYYDLNSPYSIAQATARARRRFFEAMLYAFFIYFAVGLLCGSSIEEARRDGHRRRHGNWVVDR